MHLSVPNLVLLSSPASVQLISGQGRSLQALYAGPHYGARADQLASASRLCLPSSKRWIPSGLAFLSASGKRLSG